MSQDSRKTIVELYHNSHSLVRHHLDSYNHFIDVDMKKIIKAKGKISLPDLNWYLEFGEIEVKKPTECLDAKTKVNINPQECRSRSYTYASDIVATVRYSNQERNSTLTRKNVIIGRMPVMVRSKNCNLYNASDNERVKKGECRYDPGGYFIMRGTERVFLMQEQMAKNRMIIEKDKIVKKGGIKVPGVQKITDSDIVCHVVSSTIENKSKTTVFKNSGYWYAQNTMFTESIPLFILFAALGMPEHECIFRCIGVESDLHNDLVASAIEQNSHKIFSQNQALQWLVTRIKVTASRPAALMVSPQTTEEAEACYNAVKEELKRRVLNHVPATTESLIPRARFLALMVRNVVLAERGIVLPDDRDFYGTKRIDLVGYFLSLAFDDKLQTFMEMLKKEVEKTLKTQKTKPLDPCSLMKDNIITEGMFSHIFTGNWTLRRFMMDRNKVTEILNRLSYIATLGNLCKITSQFEKVRKVSGARSIHLSQYGLVCTADTPEGEACGLIKNLAFMVEITVELSEEPIARLIMADDNFEYSLDKFEHGLDKFLVMLNGVAIGWTRNPWQLGSDLRQKRRLGLIHHHVSIYFQTNDMTLHVSSDSGKMVRPYIVCDSEGRSRMTNEILDGIADGRYNWQYLVSNGIVEYIDAKEGYAECYVAATEDQLTETHTHLDIDPGTMLGPVASLIPFPHHNQSPRNTYQCAMGKQALGVIATNQALRFDGTQHLLVNPQTPLTISTTAKLVNYTEMPAGQNAIVAITCFGGHDIEDALIVNKASLERGLLRSMSNKSYSDILKENDAVGMAVNAFRNEKEIESDGTPGLAAFIGNGDVVINKLTTAAKPPMVAKDQSGVTQAPAAPKPSPTIYHGLERTQVRTVLMSSEDHGYSIVKVATNQMRTPEVGDKLSSRHGQKGVIGRVVPMEEMPYTEDGIVPDIIMNPHGFPSRMTVGKLIELLANKAAVMDGQIRNSSCFVEAGHKEITGDYSRVLAEHGYSYSGKEVMLSGIDGRIMEADIYVGPVFYQRLKHMVQDKVHARSTGKNVPLTRQPKVGRSNDGGLRVGEMERDCLIAYGATQIIKERMMLSSDPFKAWVCEECGLFATSKTWCQMCRSSQHVSSVIIPYASKLLIQELGAVNIKVKLTLSKHDAMV